MYEVYEVSVMLSMDVDINLLENTYMVLLQGDHSI